MDKVRYGRVSTREDTADSDCDDGALGPGHTVLDGAAATRVEMTAVLDDRGRTTAGGAAARRSSAVLEDTSADQDPAVTRWSLDAHAHSAGRRGGPATARARRRSHSGSSLVITLPGVDDASVHSTRSDGGGSAVGASGTSGDDDVAPLVRAPAQVPATPRCERWCCCAGPVDRRVTLCCVWSCLAVMAVAAFLGTVGVVVRNSDEGLYDRVIAVFDASNCTAAANGTFFLDIPDAQARPLDLREPEEELLGTVYCRLCNRSLLLIGDILQ